MVSTLPLSSMAVAAPLVALASTAAAMTFARRVRRRERDLAHALETALGEVEAARKQLESQERLTSLGMLAAGIAHEINNPMSYVTSNVRGLAEDLAAMDVLPPALEPYIAEILPDTLDGIQRVNAIVADLRSFARADRGLVAEFDLNEQVNAALRLSHGSLSHRVQIVKRLGALPPACGRAGQIAQVLVNLIVNAAQAIRDAGTVTVTTSCDPDEFKVEIRDTGHGMPPEVVRRLFTPFFTTKQVGVGTGLGLAVAHGIVRAHGGRISVQSTVGVGSTFTVYLPRACPGIAAQRAAPSRASTVRPAAA